VRFHHGNILDLEFLDGIFKQYLEKGEPIDAIMHFAAKKAIGESFAKPILYYENNVVGSMNLFKLMEKYTHCKNFIFSSTAGVYGDKDNCTETDLKLPGSPYGESKACVEMLLGSLCKVHKDWRVISLRYFNPCGAHESYLLGDEPYEYPNNLFPFIQEVIIQKREKLNIFGKDYPTPDGTCVRDYIHITDLGNNAFSQQTDT
jgi:UDP-glucose 4-epimerase